MSEGFAAIALMWVVVLTVVLGWGVYSVFRRRQLRARQELAQTEQALATEFPELVHAWGGLAVLKDAGAVRHILQDLAERPSNAQPAPSVDQRFSERRAPGQSPAAFELERIEQSSAVPQAVAAPLSAPPSIGSPEASPIAATALPVQSAVATARAEAKTPRESLLLATVQKLHSARKELDALVEEGPAWGNAAFLGAIIGFGSGSALQSGVWAWLIALLVAVAAAVVKVLSWMGHRAILAELVTDAEQTLSREFPDAVQAWGGASVLRSTVAVTKIYRDLGGEPEAKDDAVSAIDVEALPERFGVADAERERNRELTGSVRRIVQRHDGLAETSEPKPFPLPVALFVGLLLGAAVGGGVLGLGWSWFAPHSITEDHREETRVHVDFLGSSLSPESYVRLDRIAFTATALVAAAFGLLVAGTVAWLLANRRFYRLQLSLAVVFFLVPAAPIGAGVGAILSGFFSPYDLQSERSYATKTAKKVLPKDSKDIAPGGKDGKRGSGDEFEAPTQTSSRYYDFRGVSLSHTTYYLLSRKTFAGFVLAGVLTALAIVAAGVWWHLGRIHRRRRAAESKLDTEIRSLANSFPASVHLWGGCDFLRHAPTARQALLVLEAQ